jgi:UMP-CMP kinase
MSATKANECKYCPEKKSLPFCPVSVGLFIGTAALYVYHQSSKHPKKPADGSHSVVTPCTVVFVIGGPGAGKGTQCQLLQERMGWVHLSAGDLLRAERTKGGPLAALINSKIDAGQIVPAEITVGLIQQAMQASESNQFLIDGFPRSQGNVDAWNDTMEMHDVAMVLNFICPEEVLVGRLLERGLTSGRQDDQLDVIRKRFQIFQQESQPIVELYKDKLVAIETDVPVEDVYAKIKPLFEAL